MKFPIRRKVILLTLALSLALVAASVFISSRLFSRQSRKELTTKVQEAARSMREELLQNYSEFLLQYDKKTEQIYREEREEIEKMSAPSQTDYEEKRRYFKMLTADLFPPEQGFGLSYETLTFMLDYRNALGQLSLIASTQNMQGGSVYYYDEEHDNLVYLLDSLSQDSPNYHFPLSVDKADESFKNVILPAEGPAAFFTEDFCVGGTALSLKDEARQLTVYVSFRTSTEALFRTQNAFLRTSALITLGISALIALVYLFFAVHFVTRPISAVSRAASAFTGKLAEGGTLSPVSAGVRQRDELGDLSERLDTLQQKIIEYLDSLAQKTAKEESMKAELDIASRIQMEALPESGFAAPGLKLDSFIRPAKEVGGDLYDYFLTDPDHLFFVIADVSGKGIPAALFMMRGKEIIRAAAHQGKSPGEIASLVNAELCQGNEEGLFISAFFGILELSTHQLRYARAGHEQPFLLRGGRAEKISEESNIVLGLFEFMTFEEDSLQMEPGDRLLLYTDGLNEGINLQAEEFGYERIAGILESEAEDLPAALYEGLKAFTGGAEQFDDVTMLLLKIGETERFVFPNPDYDVITSLCDSLEERLSDYDPEARSQVGMMTDEIINNIVSYAFEDRPPAAEKPELDVELSVSGEQICLRFTDNGKPFNPLTADSPDTEENPLTRAAGGLGIFFVKQFSDTVSYEYRDGRNCLRLIKNMTAPKVG